MQKVATSRTFYILVNSYVLFQVIFNVRYGAEVV